MLGGQMHLKIKKRGQVADLRATPCKQIIPSLPNWLACWQRAGQACLLLHRGGHKPGPRRVSHGRGGSGPGTGDKSKVHLHSALPEVLAAGALNEFAAC